MNHPEHEFAANVIRHLDYGVAQLEAGTRERLFAARNAALAHYREEPAAGVAWMGARQLLTIGALVAALVGIAYWQSNAPVNELAEIDTFLLSDELPPNAYLDKGFDSWLKRSSH